MKLKLIVLWLIVGLPLAWGITKSIQNVLKLFQ
jgi:hypothetical protein